MLAISEVKQLCLNVTYHYKCCPLLVLPFWKLIYWERRCRCKEKVARKTGRKKGLYWLCRKFHNWKSFLKSESHWKDSWLSWGGRRKGREQWSKELCLFLSTEGTQSKKQVLCDTQWTLLFSLDGHRAARGRITVCLSLTFCLIRVHILRHFVPWWSQIL